ncbi:Secreted protein OS=Streptomyces glaucescens OX=1907 GN=SGLAU_12460 PE=4 SV=1 [Streptomyces glaucescens]
MPASSAATPAHNGGAPAPVSQSDAKAASATSAQATTQTYGSLAPRQAAPQRGTQVAPQINPQLNPQVSPQITPQAPQSQQGGTVHQNNLFRPYQECSPQTLLDANVPIALLAAAQTRGVDCTQANSQANSLASATAMRQ